MNRKRTALAASALALPVLVAFGARADSIAFSPEQGKVVDKELAIDVSLYMDDFTMLVDGQDMGGQMGAMDEALAFSMLIGVTDEYVETSSGRPVKLLRTFNEISAEGGTESERESADGVDELEDETILFAWNADEEVYEKTYYESEGDEKLIENLEVDMDLLAMLPDFEVEEGDSWEVAGKEALTIFMPGGFPGSSEGEGDEEITELLQQELEYQFEDAFGDFAIVCTYEGKREEDGVELAVVSFDFDGEGAIDLSELIMTIIDLQTEGQDMDLNADVTAGLELSLVGDGELLWDQSAGTFRSYDMNCEMTVFADMMATMEMMGQVQEMEMTAEMSGDGVWSMTTDSGAGE